MFLMSELVSEHVRYTRDHLASNVGIVGVDEESECDDYVPRRC